MFYCKLAKPLGSRCSTCIL